MARFRRVRWIAVTVAVAALVGGLAAGAEAWADRGAGRCAAAQQAAERQAAERQVDRANPVSQADQSWRAGAFKAAGCRAWRRMHHREPIRGRAVR
jgi:hypothetical protein